MPAPVTHSRPGRPARIGRQEIAEAVLEIGLSQVTMRAVAERLGVSVPGLYHWVNGKEGLLRLAVDHCLGATPIPIDRGQPWWEWLRAWARHTASSLGHDPVLLQQFLSGRIGVERMVVTLERVVDVLVAAGFGVSEAKEAFDAVMAVAVGAAASRVREQSDGASGLHFQTALREMVERDPDDYPRLTALVDDVGDGEDQFEDQLTTVLVGIAVRRGDDWRAVVPGTGTRPPAASLTARRPSGRQRR